MIRTIFIPQSLGSYFLVGTRRAGMDIGTEAVYATIIKAQGRKRVIEQTLEEAIPTGGSADENIIQALTALRQRLGTVDEIIGVIPSSHVIFKELHVPFIGIKKAKMVVPFEIESQLPFPLDKAVIDCIPTHENNETKETDLLIAAVQKETVTKYLHYFDAAGIPVTALSTDMIELYKLYEMSAPSEEKPVTALVDIGYHETPIAISINRRLAYIRTLPQGLLNQQTTEGQSLHAIEEQLYAEGDNETKTTLKKLLGEIQFTIDAYKKQNKLSDANTKIVLTGIGAGNSQLTSHIQDILGMECVPFQPKELLSTEITTAIPALAQKFLMSIAAAMKPSEEFNLNQEAAEAKEDTLISYQLITLGALTLLILLSFGLYSIFRIRTLRHAHYQAQQEAIQELQKSFKLKPAQTVDLTAANKAATNELRRQESAWNNLSQENRYAFLNYLTELSGCLNTKDTQLEIASLVIKPGVIKLFGSVPGYPQLTKLQKQLECPMFKKLPKLQDWNFKTEPITLIVQKD
jgi:type IV pilus assembly protein PilM